MVLEGFCKLGHRRLVASNVSRSWLVALQFVQRDGREDSVEQVVLLPRTLLLLTLLLLVLLLVQWTVGEKVGVLGDDLGKEEKLIRKKGEKNTVAPLISQKRMTLVLLILRQIKGEKTGACEVLWRWSFHFGRKNRVLVGECGNR